MNNLTELYKARIKRYFDGKKVDASFDLLMDQIKEELEDERV